MAAVVVGVKHVNGMLQGRICIMDAQNVNLGPFTPGSVTDLTQAGTYHVLFHVSNLLFRERQANKDDSSGSWTFEGS